MKKLLEKEAAWLAGFIDGDGYFTCAVWERIAKKSKVPSVTIAPRIGVTQAENERRVLDYIVDLTGIGKVYIKQELSNSLTSQNQGMWIVSKLEDILELCNVLHPFMLLKKRQCEIMSQLTTHRMNTVISRGERSNFRRTPIEDTLYCAELGLSLNPNATAGRNSQHNSEKRTWEYWKKRIPEIYAEASNMIQERTESKRIMLKCNACGTDFERLKCNVREGTKHNFCSIDCGNAFKRGE